MYEENNNFNQNTVNNSNPPTPPNRDNISQNVTAGENPGVMVGNPSSSQTQQGYQAERNPRAEQIPQAKYTPQAEGYRTEQNTEGYNEFSYYPPNEAKQKRRNKKGHFLGALLAVMTVVAIGTTTLVGYTLLSGKYQISKAGSNENSSSQSGKNNSLENTNNSRTNIPTIAQLSTPDDALSIPEIVDKVAPSVVGIACTSGNASATGTGIIMSEDGYILTNAHVVNGANQISVVLSKALDSEQLEAELIGMDVQTDVAVLKVKKTGLPAVDFGTSSELVVGEAAIVIGNPLGFELEGSVTAGIISALDRELTIEDKEMNLIQTDASINSGNSGGPLINAYGQVIGITSAKINSTYGEGLGFAIPIDDALPIVEDLMEHGYVKRPVFGVSGENINEVYAQFNNVPQGFIVRAVTEGSGAEKAGIKINDIIIGINGETITTIEQFNKIKSDFKAGDTIKVSYHRNGKTSTVEVVLIESQG